MIFSAQTTFIFKIRRVIFSSHLSFKATSTHALNSTSNLPEKIFKFLIYYILKQG